MGRLTDHGNHPPVQMGGWVMALLQGVGCRDGLDGITLRASIGLNGLLCIRKYPTMVLSVSLTKVALCPKSEYLCLSSLVNILRKSRPWIFALSFHMLNFQPPLLAPSPHSLPLPQSNVGKVKYKHLPAGVFVSDRLAKALYHLSFQLFLSHCFTLWGGWQAASISMSKQPSSKLHFFPLDSFDCSA